MVVLTELHEDGKPAIVAVHINREQANNKVNKIAGVYGKSGIMSLFQGAALYADMTKIGKWTAIEGLQLPKIVESVSRGVRILNPGDVVKWKNEKDLPQVHFSICGLKAKTANEYIEKGADYTDPADGQRKFVLPVAGARLRSDVMPGCFP